VKKKGPRRRRVGPPGDMGGGPECLEKDSNFVDQTGGGEGFGNWEKKKGGKGPATHGRPKSGKRKPNSHKERDRPGSGKWQNRLGLKGKQCFAFAKKPTSQGKKDR